MKTVNFKSFAKDKIQEKELEFFKRWKNGSGDPVEDLITPPRR